MYNAFKNVLDRVSRWVVLSSSNPTQVSLSVKALFTAVVPYIMLVVGIGHWNIGPEYLNMVINFIGDVIFYGLSLLAAVMGLIGVGRKLWLSLNGQNPVNQ